MLARCGTMELSNIAGRLQNGCHFDEPHGSILEG